MPDPSNDVESFKLMYAMYNSYKPYKLKISPSPNRRNNRCLLGKKGRIERPSVEQFSSKGLLKNSDDKKAVRGISLP